MAWWKHCCNPGPLCSARVNRTECSFPVPFSSERLIPRLKPPTNKHVGAAHPKPTPVVCQRSCRPEGSSTPSIRQGTAVAGTRAGRAVVQVNQPPSHPLGTRDHRSPHVCPPHPISPRGPAPDAATVAVSGSLGRTPSPSPHSGCASAHRTDCPLSLLSIRAGVTHQHGKSPAWDGGGQGNMRMSHRCFLSQGQECLHWGCQLRAHPSRRMPALSSEPIRCQPIAHDPLCPLALRRWGQSHSPAPDSIPAAAGAGPSWPGSPPGCRSSGSSATCH